MSGARSRTEDFSRKVAKAVLSPREDIDVAIGTGDHGEGGSEVEEADVYEVVDRYKQELEEIISNLKPQGRGVAGVASRKPVRRAWGDEGDDEAVGEEDLEVYRRALADDDGDGNDRVGVGVRALSDFGRDVESFRERVVGTKQQEPPPSRRTSRTTFSSRSVRRRARARTRASMRGAGSRARGATT